MGLAPPPPTESDLESQHNHMWLFTRGCDQRSPHHRGHRAPVTDQRDHCVVVQLRGEFVGVTYRSVDDPEAAVSLKSQRG